LNAGNIHIITLLICNEVPGSFYTLQNFVLQTDPLPTKSYM